MTTASNALVAQAAGELVVLPLRELALIGIMVSANAQAALIRTANGQIVKVGPGTLIGDEQVAAIDAEGLILSRAGRSRRLALPPG